MKSIHGGTGKFMYALLDRATLAVIAYRILSRWRRSFFDIPVLRPVLERGFEILVGIHLPSATVIGGGLVIHHGFGIVVNAKSRLGENVTLYHRVTIGERYPGDECPTLETGVVVGCGAVVLGPVVIPPNAIVPANSVITPRSLPSHWAMARPLETQ